MGNNSDGSMRMLYQFKYSHYKDQMVMWVPYLCNINTKTSKDTVHIITGPWQLFPESLIQERDYTSKRVWQYRHHQNASMMRWKMVIRLFYPYNGNSCACKTRLLYWSGTRWCCVTDSLQHNFLFKLPRMNINPAKQYPMTYPWKPIFLGYITYC